MQRFEVSGAVRLIYKSLGVKGLILTFNLIIYVILHFKSHLLSIYNILITYKRDFVLYKALLFVYNTFQSSV